MYCVPTGNHETIIHTTKTLIFTKKSHHYIHLQSLAMKLIITLFILTFWSFNGFGQSYSQTVDSLTIRYIQQLPEDQQRYFDSILAHRNQTEWLKRMDTTQFDLAFVEETYCYSDTNSRITERYFDQTDSIPKIVFINGNYHDPSTIYDGFLIWHSQNVTYFTTRIPLTESYSRLNPTQELRYNKLQVWSHGCVAQENGKQLFEVERSKELQTTYQIQTFIDRIHKTILVSVQYAPQQPVFEVYSYNPVWDW